MDDILPCGCDEYPDSLKRCGHCPQIVNASYLPDDNMKLFCSATYRPLCSECADKQNQNGGVGPDNTDTSTTAGSGDYTDMSTTVGSGDYTDMSTTGGSGETGDSTVTQAVSTITMMSDAAMSDATTVTTPTDVDSVSTGHFVVFCFCF